MNFSDDAKERVHECLVELRAMSQQLEDQLMLGLNAAVAALDANPTLGSFCSMAHVDGIDIPLFQYPLLVLEYADGTTREYWLVYVLETMGQIRFGVGVDVIIR